MDRNSIIKVLRQQGKENIQDLATLKALSEAILGMPMTSTPEGNRTAQDLIKRAVPTFR